jgi:hypothetical protein
MAKNVRQSVQFFFMVCHEKKVGGIRCNLTYGTLMGKEKQIRRHPGLADRMSTSG